MNSWIFVIFLAAIDTFLVTCHRVEKREIDEQGYNWEAGPPKLEKFHYHDDDTIDFAPRIIGGMPAWLGDFPAKVSVQTRAGRHFCGGAIINPRHLLTAAHCLVDDIGRVLQLNTVRLMADDTSIQTHGAATRQIRFPSHFFLHPSFDVVTYTADIAVVRTSVAFAQTTTLRPLPRSFNTPMERLSCNLAGWGVTAETNVLPHPVLLRVQIDIVDQLQCNQTYFGTIPQGHFCAGSLDGSRDACFGDSGGGLICSGEIAGIVSFGFGCGRVGFPGAYVDVSQFNHWIDQCLNADINHEDIATPSPFPPNPNDGRQGAPISSVILVVTLMIKLLL